MSNLDEISQSIGALQADMKRVIRYIERAEPHLSSIPAMQKDLEDIKPIIEDYKNKKYIGYGVIVTLGALGGFIGDKCIGFFRDLSS